MRDWKSSGLVKIERAKEHIRYLEAEIAAFKGRKPYRVLQERDPNFDDSFVGVVRGNEKIPNRWGAIAADAIHNLDVALDHLWQRALYGPKVRRNDHFPVFESGNEADARFQGKERGRCREAVDLLRCANAFHIGNPYWIIRQLDNADKHDTMRLVACDILMLRGDIVPTLPIRLLTAPVSWLVKPEKVFEFSFERFQPIEDGTVLYRFSRRAPKVLQFIVDTQHDLTFEIAFGEGEILEGEAVIPTLHKFAAAVSRVSKLFTAAKLLD